MHRAPWAQEYTDWGRLDEGVEGKPLSKLGLDPQVGRLRWGYLRPTVSPLSGSVMNPVNSWGPLLNLGGLLLWFIVGILGRGREVPVPISLVKEIQTQNMEERTMLKYNIMADRATDWQSNGVQDHTPVPYDSSFLY